MSNVEEAAQAIQQVLRQAVAKGLKEVNPEVLAAYVAERYNPLEPDYRVSNKVQDLVEKKFRPVLESLIDRALGGAELLAHMEKLIKKVLGDKDQVTYWVQDLVKEALRAKVAQLLESPEVRAEILERVAEGMKQGKRGMS